MTYGNQTIYNFNPVSNGLFTDVRDIIEGASVSTPNFQSFQYQKFLY